MTALEQSKNIWSKQKVIVIGDTYHLPGSQCLLKLCDETLISMIFQSIHKNGLSYACSSFKYIKDSIFEYRGLFSSSQLEKIISDLLKDFYVGAAYTHVYAISNGRDMKGYNNFSIMLYRL